MFYLFMVTMSPTKEIFKGTSMRLFTYLTGRKLHLKLFKNINKNMHILKGHIFLIKMWQVESKFVHNHKDLM